MMEVPSTGTPFVSTRTSPGRAPPVVTSRALSTSPSMVPTTMGRSSPGVTSVWPPTRATRCDSARGAELREERGDLRLGGTPLGKETRGQEPARNRAAHGEVVGVDHQGVPAQVLRHERDRIRRGDQVAVAHVEHGRVLADPGPDDDPRIRHRVPGQELTEQGRTELAEGERAGHSSRASIASLAECI